MSPRGTAPTRAQDSAPNTTPPNPSASSALPGGGPEGDAATRTTVPRWLADLLMGARFTLLGGRESWARTALTALGVGLGVTVLLLAASVPHLLHERDQRSEARENVQCCEEIPPSERTALYLFDDTEYRGERVRGRLLWPDGDHPPVPPGLSQLPGEGEMAVSPALRDLLRSPEGELLRERLPYRVTATLTDEGLLSPNELTYYAVDERLTGHEKAERVDHFGSTAPSERMDPALLVVVVVACVVLLLPVGAFVAAAVRFGGERRDRRLAALRLIGADSRMAHRVAAGEALVGALLGLAVGGALFLVARRYADVAGFFPAHVRPTGWLLALVVVAVPTAAVLVTLLAMRRVAVEPLGVVRGSGPRRQRLWWRLALPAVGLLLLLPLLNDSRRDGGDLATYQLAMGAFLLLLGVTALLPWLVQVVVRRLGGGPVSVQLALRRLQLDSAAAARAVSGITLAVAGAIALQMLFMGVADDYRSGTDQHASRHQLLVRSWGDYERAQRMVRDLARTEGVRQAHGRSETYAVVPTTDEDEDESYHTIVTADCATLRTLAELPDCGRGDVFLRGASEDGAQAPPRPGTKLRLNPPEMDEETTDAAFWTVPRDARTVRLKDSGEFADILVTPEVSGLATSEKDMLRVDVSLDDSPDAEELARNTVARHGPGVDVVRAGSDDVDGAFAAVQRGLYVGAVVLLALIGASMLVSMVEQLRERRRLLSVLVAFGTPRATLARSVLWQTAVPVLLGMTLAVLGGLGLGALLLRMVDKPLVVDWTGLGALVGSGALLILLVTALSLPALWRMMRPEGLRSE